MSENNLPVEGARYILDKIEEIERADDLDSMDAYFDRATELDAENARLKGELEKAEARASEAEKELRVLASGADRGSQFHSVKRVEVEDDDRIRGGIHKEYASSNVVLAGEGVAFYDLDGKDSSISPNSDAVVTETPLRQGDKYELGRHIATLVHSPLFQPVFDELRKAEQRERDIRAELDTRVSALIETIGLQHDRIEDLESYVRGSYWQRLKNALLTPYENKKIGFVPVPLKDMQPYNNETNFHWKEFRTSNLPSRREVSLYCGFYVENISHLTIRSIDIEFNFFHEWSDTKGATRELVCHTVKQIFHEHIAPGQTTFFEATFKKAMDKTVKDKSDVNRVRVNAQAIRIF